MKEVMEMDCGDGCKTLQMYLLLFSIHLKIVKMLNFNIILKTEKKIRAYLFVQIYAGCMLYTECTVAGTHHLCISNQI